MREALGIVATDGINRKNHRITVGALLNAYKDAWKYGLPSSVNHDSTKFIGWTFLSGMYFEPGMAYVTNSFYEPENQEEMNKLKQYNADFHTMRYVVERTDDYNKLKNRLGESLSESFHVATMYHAVAYEDKNIVLRAIPELSEIVKDGMVELAKLNPIFPGVFAFGDYVVFAHRLFRRSGSLLNGLNKEFLEKFQKVDPKLNPRITIDLDVIGLKDSVHDECEYAYWWGPKFNNDLSQIDEGVTRHENARYDELFSNIKNTDFYWYNHDESKTFECEELNCRAIKRGDTESYDCRYVHSRLGENDCVIHLDGAIRNYDEEAMVIRMDKKLDEVGHEASYKKLWRIDGDIDIILWKELITHFFRDNTLVGEYLGGRDEKFEQIVIEDKRDKNCVKTAKKYIPVNMEKGNGLRFFFSYKRKKDNKDEKNTVYAKPIQVISTDDGMSFKSIIESETITLLKSIMRNGEKVRLPDTERIAYEDMIFNFPLIVCESVEAGSTVLKSFYELIRAFVDRNDDRLVSITLLISGCVEDDVLLSLAGHVNDFFDVFSVIGTVFPKGDELESWLMNLYKTNTEVGRMRSNEIKVYDLLNRDGFLFFERALVPSNYIQRIDYKASAVYATSIVSDEVMREIKELNLRIAPAYIVKKSKCMKCGRDYVSCNCIKFVEDVGEQVEEVERVGFYWTNRLA